MSPPRLLWLFALGIGPFWLQLFANELAKGDKANHPSHSCRDLPAELTVQEGLGFGCAPLLWHRARHCEGSLWSNVREVEVEGRQPGGAGGWNQDLGVGCLSNAGTDAAELVMVSECRAATAVGFGLDLGWVELKPEVSPATKELLWFAGCWFLCWCKISELPHAIKSQDRTVLEMYSQKCKVSVGSIQEETRQRPQTHGMNCRVFICRDKSPQGLNDSCGSLPKQDILWFYDQRI